MLRKWILGLVAVAGGAALAMPAVIRADDSNNSNNTANNNSATTRPAGDAGNTAQTTIVKQGNGSFMITIRGQSAPVVPGQRTTVHLSYQLNAIGNVATQPANAGAPTTQPSGQVGATTQPAMQPDIVIKQQDGSAVPFHITSNSTTQPAAPGK